MSESLNTSLPNKLFLTVAITALTAQLLLFLPLSILGFIELYRNPDNFDLLLLPAYLFINTFMAYAVFPIVKTAFKTRNFVLLTGFFCLPLLYFTFTFPPVIFFTVFAIFPLFALKKPTLDWVAMVVNLVVVCLAGWYVISEFPYRSPYSPMVEVWEYIF